jgi:GTP-binding protein
MTITSNEAIRNIAIIAHVDHGKTTLVDHMFRQGGVFRDNQDIAERVMDSGDIEKERGITISAKNCSVFWKGTKINILDTPGHADFGSEVERALMMVDGAILLVDSAEGPLPQTRFVLRKALDLGLKIIVCVNKIDRPDARPQEVLNEIYDLFIDLDANDEQIEFPVLYTIGRNGIAQSALDQPAKDLSVLFESIIEHVPAPTYDSDEPFQMLVANLGYSDFVGRLAIGRVMNGSVKANETLVRIDKNSEVETLRVVKLQAYRGTSFDSIEKGEPGDIIIIAGLEEVEIGDTICTKESPKALPRISVEEPTVAMLFTINTSPFSGREGKLVQSQKIKERLYKEVLVNVGLKVEELDNRDAFLVKGRGEFQLAILIETMRREGFELCVGRPQILFKYENGLKLEPIENLQIDCDEEHLGFVTERLSMRKGRMTNMVNHGHGRVRVDYSVPSRALIGFGSDFMTNTRGTGIMNSYLAGYEEYRGDFPARTSGSLVSDRLGESVTYGLFHLEPRGRLFIGTGEPVYEGMVIGEHNRGNDLNVNPCKAKKLTNMRASGKDDALTLTPVTPLSLERAIEFIADDEMVEVTPKSIRMRKIELRANMRTDKL